jgi:molecular chaperone GrpE
MSERDRDRRDEEERPRVRITDRRRFVEPEDAASHEAASPGDKGSASPADAAGAASAVDPGPTGPEASVAQDAMATELDEARARAEEYRHHLQRLQAEFDNYRKRVLKEQTHAVEMAAEPAIRRLLEVVDDFELALMAANERPDFDRFLHGVELVYAKLFDALRAEGLERIEAEGKPFDPELHEALMQTGEGDHVVVADVLRSGYTLRGRVIRPAGVRVERK